MQRTMRYLGILNVVAFLALAGVSTSVGRAAEAEQGKGCCQVASDGDGFCCINCSCEIELCEENYECPDRPLEP